MSGAANLSASPKARARWLSRATWTRTTARLSASLARARVRSAVQKASKPSATEDSVSEPPLASSAIARLRSVTMQGQFEAFIYGLDRHGYGRPGFCEKPAYHKRSAF